MHRLKVSVLIACAIPAIGSAAGDRPNIVLILADDFGVGDIQAHYPTNKIATPYLDRLVRQALSFADAHSPSSVCSPTRYGLLTGRYAWRTRLQEWVIAAYEPPLISHFNHGEFAYRDGPWKLVFKMSGRNLDQSRGKPTIAELYHLGQDIAEAHDLAKKHPEIVRQMTDRLTTLIARGASRPGPNRLNDTMVRFQTIQTSRWGPSLD